MSDLFGQTRTTVRSRYALFTPDGFVASHLPGWKNALVTVNISPALAGPRFMQLHVTLEKEAAGEGNTGANEYFIYVLEGTGALGLPEKRHRLETGSFIYLPPGRDLQIKSNGPPMRLLIFQKPYEAMKGVAQPATIVAHEREVKGLPSAGTEGVQRQSLLPDEPAFDLAVNIYTFQPGATLPRVRSQIMEQGLLLLDGQGIFRLEEDFHPVKTGDVLWLASYCPHWFVAMGKSPASYICYHDVNRDPM